MSGIGTEAVAAAAGVMEKASPPPVEEHCAVGDEVTLHNLDREYRYTLGLHGDKFRWISVFKKLVPSEEQRADTLTPRLRIVSVNPYHPKYFDAVFAGRAGRSTLRIPSGSDDPKDPIGIRDPFYVQFGRVDRPLGSHRDPTDSAQVVAITANIHDVAVDEPYVLK